MSLMAQVGRGGLGYRRARCAHRRIRACVGRVCRRQVLMPYRYRARGERRILLNADGRGSEEKQTVILADRRVEGC